ncbi:MAG: hypothetical protein L0M00_15095 [Lactiplantibacillus plantarum]|nr:hypothetical protein [Lactiplantibacillus plantarum]
METTYEMIVCANCNHTVPSGNFCTCCGQHLFEEQGHNVFSTSFCVNCGAQTPNAKYCSVCGFEKDFGRIYNVSATPK